MPYTLQKMREILGSNQQQLADYLDITKSNLSMIELGSRPFPLKTVDRFMALEKMLRDPGFDNVKLLAFETREKTANNVWCSEQATIVQERLGRLKKQLSDIKGEYSQELQILKSVSKVPITETGKKLRRQQGVLYIWTQGNIDRLEKCWTIAQNKLKIRIAQAELELQMLEEMRG